MAIRLVVTRGFGNGTFSGSIKDVARRGFGTITASNFFMSQIHNIRLIDNDTPVNSIDINTVITSQIMPTQTQIFSGVTHIGNLAGFPVQAYVPVLLGGALDGSKEADKFQQYNSDYSVGNFDKGIDVIGAQITAQSATDLVGSYLGGVGTTIEITDILVGNKGVLKITGAPTVDTASYSVLQGSDTEITEGFQYPVVWRQIKSTDASGEYAHYNGGGTVPWAG